MLLVGVSLHRTSAAMAKRCYLRGSSTKATGKRHYSGGRSGRKRYPTPRTVSRKTGSAGLSSI